MEQSTSPTVYLVLNNEWNQKNYQYLIGFAFRTPISYARLLNVPESDERIVRIFENSSDYDEWNRIGDTDVPKGSFGGKCSRTVCNQIAMFQSMPEPHRFYCHHCALRINKMNMLGKQIIELIPGVVVK